MEINFAHLCDYALVADGKLSVLGIFDRIRPQAMPWMHPTLYLAFEIELEPAEMGSTFKTRIAIQDEDGEALFAGEGEVTTQGPVSIDKKPKARQVLCINGLKFKRVGPHQVVIWLQGIVKHTLRFEIAPPPNTAPDSDA